MDSPQEENYLHETVGYTGWLKVARGNMIHTVLRCNFVVANLKTKSLNDVYGTPKGN